MPQQPTYLLDFTIFFIQLKNKWNKVLPPCVTPSAKSWAHFLFLNFSHIVKVTFFPAAAENLIIFPVIFRL